MADPLVMTLRSLQAAADNNHSSAPLTWVALRNQGIPVGYKEFAARWDDEEEDGILHTLVKKFDQYGLHLKTQNSEPEQGEQSSGPDLVGQMAKHATDNALKKGL